MSGRSNDLRSARRIAAAIAIGLLVEAAAIGAIGFAAAGDTAETVTGPSPDRLGLPAPHVGDHGSYDVTLIRETDDGYEVLGHENETIRFEVLEPRTMPDADGTSRHVWRYQYRSQGLLPETVANYSVPADSFELIAVEDITREQDPGYDDTDSHAVRHHRWYPAPRDNRINGVCGVKNALQGQTIAIDDPIELFNDCGLPEAYLRDGKLEVGDLSLTDRGTINDRPYSSMRFVANGTETVGGYETVRFSAVIPGVPSDAYEVHVWFAESLPYPVKIARGSFLDDDTYTVTRLSRFDGGDGPALQRRSATGDDAPAIDLAEREVWGPSETGLDHPLPLSRAFELARDNPDDSTLRDYLDDHPDAYVSDARYRYSVENTTTSNTVEHTWDFDVTDGSTRIEVDVDRLTERAHVPDQRTVTLHPLNETDFRYEDDTADRTPDPSRIPDRLPTVASVMARWTAYATDHYDDRPANSWTFRIYCRGTDCDRVETRIDAGHTRARADDGVITPTTRTYNESLLTVDATGRTVELREARRRVQHEDGPGPSNPDDGDDPPQTGSAPTTAGGKVTIPLWRSPPIETAATVGIVAAIVGLLYWAWPAIKTLPAASLFTRLTRDEVLDHPARAELMEVVEDRPGIHFAEIARRSDLGEGATRHHLRKLADADLITRHRAQGYTCYFPQGEVDRRLRAAAPALKADGARRVMSAVTASPGASAKQIAEATDLSPSTVHHHVQRLREAGLIEGQRDGRHVALRPTDIGRGAVDRFEAA